MGVETLGFGFATPKKHFLARNRVVLRILRQNRCTRLGCIRVVSVLDSGAEGPGFKSQSWHCDIPGGPKKRPELSHGVMQQSRWNESAEKHECNEQTSWNMSMNFHLKHFYIGRDTSEIVLHFIKQCLQAVRHLCSWLYAGYTRTSQ